MDFCAENITCVVAMVKEKFENFENLVSFSSTWTEMNFFLGNLIGGSSILTKYLDFCCESL